MPSNSQDPLECVGTIYRWNPRTNKVTNPQRISAYHSLYIGRDRKISEYIFDDIRVSAQHLRIYTVVYDFDNPLEVAPLVYAQDLSLNGTFWNGQPIDRRNGGAVLLSDGDVLRLSPESYLEFRCNYQVDKPLTRVQREECFMSEYLITDRLLGEGSFGQVHMAVNLQSGSQVACKVVDLRAIKKAVEKRMHRGEWRGTNLLDLQMREVSILENLCHPNIIRVEKVIRTENTMYMFEDLITAGDLFTFVESMGGSITDIDAASIMQQILAALDYLHDKNIVHRDLKPENILMTSHGDGRRVVLADFGCAQIIPSKIKRMSTVVGTWHYTAPEVYKKSATQGYTKAVDLWSVGCIAVVLLIGAPPFPFSPSGSIECDEPGDMDEVFKNTRWNEASALAQNFVLSLLVLDEKKRLTAKEALRHCWFTNAEYKSRLYRDYQAAIRDWSPRGPQSPITVSQSQDLVPHLRADIVGEGIEEYKLPENSKPLQCGLESVGSPNNLFPSNEKLSALDENPTQSNLGRGRSCSNLRVSMFSKPSKKGGLAAAKPTAHQESSHDVETSTGDFGDGARSAASRLRRPFSPQAWSVLIGRSRSNRSRQIKQAKGGQAMDNIEVAESKAKQGELSGPGYSQGPNENNDSSTTEPLLIHLSGTKRRLSSAMVCWSEQSEEGGEVYEEVENRITGKIRRVPYGERQWV